MTSWLEVIENIESNNTGRVDYSGRVDLPTELIEQEAKEGLLRAPQTKEANYADLEKDILDFGLRQPIQVRKTASGKFVILNGVQRHSIHVKNGIPTIKAEYFPNVKNPNDVLVFQVSSNIHQVTTKPVQLANQLQRIRSLNPNITQAEMASMINKSQAYVGQILKINALDEDVKKLIEDGTIILINGIKLAQLPYDDVEHFLDRAKDMSGEEFCAVVDQHLMRIKNERKGEGTVWAPNFKLRTGQEVKAEINRINTLCGSPDLRSVDMTNPEVRKGYLYALNWVGNVDPISIDQQVKEHEEFVAQREKQKAERKAAREAEQAAKNGAKVESTIVIKE